MESSLGVVGRTPACQPGSQGSIPGGVRNFSFYSGIGGGGEGWLGFPDLWSGQKPRWNWCLTPVANFGEVRRAQLAKSALLTSSLVPLGSFRSFRVCSDAKERVGWGKQREATAPIKSIVKQQPWFLSLRWRTCLRQNCILGFSACSEGPAFGQSTDDDDDDAYILYIQR